MAQILSEPASIVNYFVKLSENTCKQAKDGLFVESMQEDSIQSQGGKARAKALSAEKRSEIARTAAESKWSLPKAKWGSPDKTLKIGDRELECYVLEDGTRVLSGRGMQEVLGLGQSHGALLKEFVTHKNVKPFIDNELAMELDSPLRFIRPGRGGIPAVAFEATILPKVCDAVLEARKQIPTLTRKQKEIAEQCEIITRVLSKVGIIALVDEVTGYQYDRAKTALAVGKHVARPLQPIPEWKHSPLNPLNPTKKLWKQSRRGFGNVE